MREVIPELNYAPKRKYVQTNNIIRVYNVLNSYRTVDQLCICEDTAAFTIELQDEETAKLVMNDLYYGEYTGA